MRRGLLEGALAGALWGAVARVFMRLLADDPEFSWSGTAAIVGIAAVAGACAGLAHGARAGGRRGWWRLAALPALLLFAGPGSLLVPGVIGMALVLRGRPVVRAFGVALAVAPVVLVVGGSPAPTASQWAGLALMVLSCAPLGWALGEVVGRWPRRVPSTAAQAGARTREAALA